MNKGIPRKLNILLPGEISHNNKRDSTKQRHLSESYELQNQRFANSPYNQIPDGITYTPQSHAAKQLQHFNPYVHSNRNNKTPQARYMILYNIHSLAQQFFTPSNRNQKQKAFKFPKQATENSRGRSDLSHNLHQVLQPTEEKVVPRNHRHVRGKSDVEPTVDLTQKRFSEPRNSSQQMVTNKVNNRLYIKKQTQSNEDQDEKVKKKISQLVSQIKQGQGQLFFNDLKPKKKQKPADISRQKSETSTLFIESGYYIKNLKHYLSGSDVADPFRQLYLDHFSQTFNSIHFIRHIKPQDIKAIKKLQNLVKPKTSKCRKQPHIQVTKTVVFDLDETLIHCTDSGDSQPDLTLPIIFPHGEIVEAGINVRPYAVYILSELSKLCEVIVFTASHSSYAIKVLDHLDPKNQWISHRLFREHCVLTPEQVHIKDLRVLCADRQLKNIVLVDNAAYSFGYQIFNGIPILPFYNNKSDAELLDLLGYLKFLIQQEDMRDVNKQHFKLHYYQEHTNLNDLASRLLS